MVGVCSFGRVGAICQLYDFLKKCFTSLGLFNAGMSLPQTDGECNPVLYTMGASPSVRVSNTTQTVDLSSNIWYNSKIYDISSSRISCWVKLTGMDEGGIEESSTTFLKMWLNFSLLTYR